MSTILQDLRYAMRSLLKAPALTLAAVISLGIGIGANTTIFTWVQAVLLRPIPGIPDPDAVYVAALETRDAQSRSWSYPNYRDVRDRSRLVDIMAQDDLAMSIAVGGEAERAFGAVVSGNYFQTLGVRPAAGRLFTQDDDRTPGGHPVAVLSYAYWQRRFSGDPAIVGREVTINNTPMTVVGIVERSFIGSFFGVATAAYVPMAMMQQVTGSDRLEARGSGWMQALVRVKPEASRAQADAELASVLRQIDQEHPGAVDGWRIRTLRAWEASFGAPSVLAPILGVLSVVVALVLLIACANVANLLLSRAVGRRRELAIRLSLGASRGRVLRQLLTEAMLLSLTAGLAGLVMAFWTSGVLMAFAPPMDVPIDFGLRFDRTTFLYALAVSSITGLLFGLAPAWQASRPDTVHALKEEAGRGASGGRAGHRLRGALVVSQVAVCVLLLIGATLFVRSLQAAQHIDPGFDPRGMVIATTDLFPNGYTSETGRQFQRRAAERVAAVPGVVSVAWGRRAPLGLSGGSSTSLVVDGYTPRPNEEINVSYTVVSPRYFETLRIPLAEGREFTEQNTRASAPVLIINEAMARRYWPDGKALGGRLRLGGREQPHQVVGISRNIKYRSLAEAPAAHFYLPVEQNYVGEMVLHVRSANAPGPTLTAVREAIRELDANLPLYDARSLNEHLRTAVFAQTMGANLLGAMGVLALLLAAVGLYGVIAYAVSQRTQEMGIRLALGAAPGDLLRMIVRQGLTLTTIGLVIGLTLAFVATGFMRSLLPGVTPRDPFTFIAVPLALLLIAAVAALIPARRAGSIDPVVALRYE